MGTTTDASVHVVELLTVSDLTDLLELQDLFFECLDNPEYFRWSVAAHLYL
jgi:hypothetical protein